MQPVTIKLHTVCLVRDHDRVLLLDRSAHPVLRGYIAPGGKVEFPESPLEGAIREVWEETGLQVRNLVYKGLAEFTNEQNGERYMIFNYITDTFEGELKQDSPEGEPHWVEIASLATLPMRDDFRRRLPLFFEPGTFEIHVDWDESGSRERASRT